MQFTKVSGPVLDMLGIKVKSHTGEQNPLQSAGWNEVERALLQRKNRG